MNELKNFVHLKGRISKPIQIFTDCSSQIYTATVEIKRKSGTSDFIPIRISHDLLYTLEPNTTFVEIKGFFRSIRKENKLILYVWVENILANPLEEYENTIKISGRLSKMKPLRETPLSQKCILDYFLKVNEPQYNYFPVIAWNATALSISALPLGCYISLTGRIQSREYQKHFENRASEIKTAYEISTVDYSVDF